MLNPQYLLGDNNHGIQFYLRLKKTSQNFSFLNFKSKENFFLLTMRWIFYTYFSPKDNAYIYFAFKGTWRQGLNNLLQAPAMLMLLNMFFFSFGNHLYFFRN